MKTSWIYLGLAAFGVYYLMSQNSATASPMLQPVPRRNPHRGLVGQTPKQLPGTGPHAYNTGGGMMYQESGNSGYGPGQYSNNGMGHF